MAYGASGRWARTGGLLSARFALLLTSAASGWAAEVYIPEAVPDIMLHPEQRPGYRVGPVDLYPRLSAGLLSDDNIYLTDMLKESDLIWIASPGLYATSGEPWNAEEKSLSLDYSPSFLFFTDNSDQNTVDHAARLTGRWPFSKLTLGFSQDFQKIDTVVVGVAERVALWQYGTQLNSRYELSEKTSFEINGRQTIQEYSDTRFINYSEWANDDWLNCQVTSKVNTGLGFTLGFVDVDNYPDQLYERFSARGIYALAAKLDANAAVGGEHRDYHGSEQSGEVQPVFSVGATYRPTAVTTLSLDAYRREQPSAYEAGWNYITTGFSMTVRQMVFERIALSLGSGYYNAEYKATQQEVSSYHRTDDFFFVRPSVDYYIGRHWRAGAFYQYRQNQSDQSYFEYANNQVGLQVLWVF